MARGVHRVRPDASPRCASRSSARCCSASRVTDAQHYLIPDGFTVFGLVWVLVTALVAYDAESKRRRSPTRMTALIGACAGAGAIAIAGWLGEVALKKEAMGFGDVTLMAVIGAARRTGTGVARRCSSARCIGVGRLRSPSSYPLSRLRRAACATPQLELALGDAPLELPHVPFGVFLAPAALATLLWGYDLIGWYSGR